MIEITKEEYTTLMLEHWKYTELRNIALHNKYLTDVERVIFEITEEEGENDE